MTTIQLCHMVVVKGDQKFSGTEAMREFCLGKKRLFNQSNLPKELTDQSAAMQVKIGLKNSFGFNAVFCTLCRVILKGA